MSEPTIAARLVAPLLDACARLGGAGLGLELGRRFDLDPARLRDPEHRIPLPRFYDLLEQAAAATGEDLIGMHYSLGLDPASFDVLGFLAMTSPNLGTAFERMFRYQALLAEGETGGIARARGRVTLSLVNWGPPRLAHRLWNEAAMVDIVVNGRQLVGTKFEVVEVRFRHSPPAAVERLRATLDAPLRFDAEDNAVVVPEDVLALAMPGADPALFDYFDREAARRVAEQRSPGQTVLDDVRRMIEAALPEGVPELATLAERLGCSARTLQRRLAEHGSSLRELIDDVRRELALRHLAAELSIAEVSFLLGFSQPSAFHRAFRRWTDRTPAQWRTDRLS
ncbi:MAG TPA: AraC family transcriptional regulator [Enhygromyxa sp.]|nr:AraC family transcriptional regulator [Enhygromyxa sp.]